MDLSNKLTQIQKRKKWFFLLLLPFLILLSIFTSFNSKTPFYKTHQFHQKNPQNPEFVESKLKISPISKNPIPKIAYLISGSRGDGESLKRTLKALYHPLNQYAVHLDLEAPPDERLDLMDFVERESVFREMGNVRVVAKSNLVTYRGPTMVSNTLHAMAILLKEGGTWDWFINLSASDYPLVTQDDLLHVLSTIPRELNFIEHTSDIGWKEYQRARPVIIDPGLYSTQKSDVYWVPERRGIPTAFKLYTGSAWMMLSRPFVEYCLWGWDNLPRTVLMYYANFLSSPEGYFHTVICNVEEFKNTTVNHDLHFISWDNPPKQHPHFLTVDDYEKMVESNAPFARKFGRKEAVMDKIDAELLGSDDSGFVPGKWLVRENENSTDGSLSYSVANGTIELRPGPGADRLKRLIKKLLSKEIFYPRQCTSIPL
ncbi:beta-glucuronosyltransferase GlcAT14B-like [Chenopodium quinoa]|uniref:beta-glucuronosyltransferase GlcAT14B-like n=1 Tax=Chenopodium quinoa TaxID=63459 RepID=UPI000B77E700|nr:beta-glucuronosyltransferase GlcAT14B-like [Chenopodium quinoa]